MKLHMRQTFQVQWEIEEIAQKIGDTKILAKLSTSDMIPIEAKYHCKCLAAYYNRDMNNQKEYEIETGKMQQENEITGSNAKYQCYDKVIYFEWFVNKENLCSESSEMS